MAISVTVNQEKDAVEDYPKLRMWIGDVNRADPPGPLIVLFTSQCRGIPLSGVHLDRLGKEEGWVKSDNSSVWQKVHSVIITSKD